MSGATGVRRAAAHEVEPLQRLRSLVSPYVGPVRRTATALVGPDDARLVMVACELADPGGLVGAAAELTGGAASETPEGALAAALGEAAERYSASYLPEERLVWGTAEQLGPEAVDPGRFALFSAGQYAQPGFPFERFTRATPVRWVRGVALDGSPCLLPAQLVYLTERLPPQEPPITVVTSNGLACGPSLAEATLAAFLELLERDAFMLAWQCRLTLPRIDIAGSPALRAFAARTIAATGVRCEVIDLSVFHAVPTAVAVVRGDPPDPVALAVGAAAATTAETAWRKAVCEAFATRAWARALRAQTPARTFHRDFGDVVTFEDHVHLYALRQHTAPASFLDASAETRPIAEIPPLEGATVDEQLAAIAARLARAGTSGYVVDVTAPDVAAARLRVVRAIAPELRPLDVVHAARCLGGRRLYEAAWLAGLRDRPLEETELNPFPHPFP